MTLEIGTEVSVERERLAKRFHNYVVTDHGIDPDDVHVTAYSDGTISTQLGSGIWTEDKPTVQSLELPYTRRRRQQGFLEVVTSP